MTDDDRWFLLYAQIVGIQHHPRNIELHGAMKPEDCVAATDKYFKAYKRAQDGAPKSLPRE